MMKTAMASRQQAECPGLSKHKNIEPIPAKCKVFLDHETAIWPGLARSNSEFAQRSPVRFELLDILAQAQYIRLSSLNKNHLS